MIHVCSLSRVSDVVAASGARHLVSLLAEGTAMTRPPTIEPNRHMLLSLHDIAVAQDGLTLPGEAHVRSLLDFAGAWDRRTPLVVHCFAGISRSTASAYIIAAALAPRRDEFELAETLRRLSPSATPNPRLVALADSVLGRGGRMVEAVRSIGRGADAFEGTPFVLAIDS